MVIIHFKSVELLISEGLEGKTLHIEIVIENSLSISDWNMRFESTELFLHKIIKLLFKTPAISE